MVQAPSVPKEQPKVTPVCFRKRANCGHVHHEHPTPRKSKGTHSTLKKHPVSPPAKWKAWASPEGRNKAKCLERNKNDELSNELKDCQKEKRPPAEKHSGSWCIFFEARRVFVMLLTGCEEAKRLFLFVPSLPLAVRSCSWLGLTRQRPKEEVESPL